MNPMATPRTTSARPITIVITSLLCGYYSLQHIPQDRPQLVAMHKT
jgi:hypothetical protein